MGQRLREGKNSHELIQIKEQQLHETEIQRKRFASCGVGVRTNQENIATELVACGSLCILLRQRRACTGRSDVRVVGTGKSSAGAQARDPFNPAAEQPNSCRFRKQLQLLLYVGEKRTRASMTSTTIPGVPC